MQTQTVKDLSEPLSAEERLCQEHRRYIVGQDAAIRRLVRKFTHVDILDGQARDTNKPAGVLFLFGTLARARRSSQRQRPRFFSDASMR